MIRHLAKGIFRAALVQRRRGFGILHVVSSTTHSLAGVLCKDPERDCEGSSVRLFFGSVLVCMVQVLFQLYDSGVVMQVTCEFGLGHTVHVLRASLRSLSSNKGVKVISNTAFQHPRHLDII